MNRRPAAWVHTVAPPPPSLEDNTADADRVAGALKGALQSLQGGPPTVTVDYRVMKILPERLRRWNYSLRCVVFKEDGIWRLIHVSDTQDPRPVTGLAVDIGTTRVVIRLVDLTTGSPLGESAFDNPQLAVGPDILTRIHHSDRPGGLKQLHDLLIDGLNRATDTLCRAGGLSTEDICLFSVAGNTAMTHLFLGLSPRWIIREPYIPVVNRPGTLAADALGLAAHPGARVFVFPNIGAYFGGDLIAGVLCTGMHRCKETTILVDVGTNAEVVLGNAAWLIACAGAAGPALEGGVARMGMMAAPGVIDRLSIEPRTGAFQIHTIDGLPPKGICGSGVIDLTAHLFKAGMLDIRGKLVPEACGNRLKRIDGLPHLVVVTAEDAAGGEDLTIGQAELDSLIRSKAAMFTILETLCTTVGVPLESIGTFYVAGTFGSFIDPASAVSIGMLPDLPLNAYQAVGNTSLNGAARVLTSTAALEEITAIRDRITYLELNVNQDFMNRFSAAKFLPHTDRKRFPSVMRGDSGETAG